MADTDDEIDPYRVLQVDPTADHEVIQAAYRALARRFHPDVAPDPETAQRMAAINAAFDLIRDTDRRASYDREHGHAAPPPPPADVSRPAAAATPATATDTTWTATRQGASWEGTAGPPPGRPSGSVLGFGRFKGWSLGEIARVDAGYLMWLDDRREGARYRAEIDDLLHKLNLRKDPPKEPRKRGPFGRG